MDRIPRRSFLDKDVTNPTYIKFKNNVYLKIIRTFLLVFDSLSTHNELHMARRTIFAYMRSARMASIGYFPSSAKDKEDVIGKTVHLGTRLATVLIENDWHE